MVPELVRAVTQIKVAFMSHYPQYFAVIAHNTEKHCDFCSALPSKKSHNTTGRYLPLVWELLIYSSISTLYEHSDYKKYIQLRNTKIRQLYQNIHAFLYE